MKKLLFLVFALILTASVSAHKVKNDTIKVLIYYVKCDTCDINVMRGYLVINEDFWGKTGFYLNAEKKRLGKKMRIVFVREIKRY